jgi:hypothetical protein
MNNFYKYGPPPIVNQPTVRTISGIGNEIVATSIPIDLITEVLNESLATGDVKLEETSILDSISDSSTSIANLTTAIITSNDTSIRILSDTRIEQNLLIGTSTINSDYSLDVEGSIRTTGTNAYIDNDQVRFKDNCISIGYSSNSLDKFINGFYHPKNDQFSGSGISPDKVGIISLPLGSFTNNTTYAFQSSVKKRFSDSKTSVRFTYISSDYNFDINKDSETGFSSSEQQFINSLNNYNNSSSPYYTNIESNNITLHGGNIISGLGKDFNIVLTNNNNIESTFMTFYLVDELVDFSKSIQLTLSNSYIYNSGNIIFDTNKTSIAPYFKVSNVSNHCYRDLYFDKNTSNDVNIIFGAENSQTAFGICYKETTSPIIKIDITTPPGASNTSRITMDSNLTIKGSNLENYPSLIIENNHANNVIQNITPSVRTFVQNKILAASSSTTFTFNNISNYTSGGTNNPFDYLINGHIIITNKSMTVSDHKHLHLRIDGTYNQFMTKPVINTIVLSNQNINLTDNSEFSNIFIEYIPTIANNELVIKINSNLTQEISILIKIEIIST